MKKALCLIVVLVVAAGCHNKEKQAPLDEQRYAWENIRQYCMQEPERSFAMVDTAETAGIVDANYANWMRAQIYMNSPERDLEKARECCLAILNNDNPAPDSLQHVKTYHLLVGIGTDTGDYQEAIGYAMEGARIAHENNWNGEEAEFYFKAGTIMEQVQKGSGTEYLDRSLNMFRGTSNPQALPLLASHLGSVSRMAVNNGDYARALALTNERLEATERIAREIPTAPAGYIDDQKAYIYSIQAYCEWQLGDKAAARRSAEAFEKTRASRSPEHMSDILVYYSVAGNGERIRQIYDVLEPYYREREDTISTNYAGLVQTYAYGLDKLGRGHEAFEAMDRYCVLSDSLVQRERQAETLKFAQQMKTQEKELELKDKEAEARLHWVMIISLVLLLVVGVVALWRILVAKQRLEEKNRQLYETVQQMMQQEAREQEKALSAPASPSQQLYSRLCQLMREQQPYTDSDLNRESLAQMLGTNYNAVAAAIREFSDGATLGEFLDDWRIRHAAALLRDGNDPIGLVGEMSGFASRSHFNTLFRDKFKLTPGEYRKAARGGGQEV